MIDKIYGHGFLLQAQIKSKYGGAQVNFISDSGGMTEQQISQVIHGRRKLTFEQAEVWAKALDLTTEILKPFTNSNGQTN